MARTNETSSLMKSQLQLQMQEERKVALKFTLMMMRNTKKSRELMNSEKALFVF